MNREWVVLLESALRRNYSGMTIDLISNRPSDEPDAQPVITLGNLFCYPFLMCLTRHITMIITAIVPVHSR